jgi:ABC-2 type transport system permease protein
VTGRWRAARAIASNHTWLVLSDIQLMVFVLVLPVALTLFLRPAFALILHANGFAGANGAEQAIPGAASLFGFNVGIFLAISIYRDHGWGVWDRMRSTEADTLSIVGGTSAPYYVVGFVALLLDFVMGDVFFDVPSRSAVPSILVLCAAYAFCVIGLGLLLTAITTTLQQVAAIGQPVATLLAIAGGAFMPLSVLPSWAIHIAPASPTYWAMRGFRAVLLEEQGVSTVLLPSLVLVLFGLGALGVAVLRLRAADVKTGWA